MKQNLKKILVVGGGTAGFVSALILKTRFPEVEVEIVRSKKIGIIGVGEGSTEHWNEFMKYIGVSFQTLMAECDATFKCGIMFKGWGHNDYMHSIGPENDIRNGQYMPVYAKLISTSQPNWMMNPPLTWHNKVYARHLEPNAESPYNQYHFNTFKLNEFLTKVAELKEISVIDDEILDVQLNENGEISKLVGELSSYSADFYIDCTGFAKLLISKLGAKWHSFGKYLKMKAAITFPTPDTPEYNIWTLAQAMDSGWMFRIPVWGRHGNGYIYDSDFITKEQAKDEVEKYFGHEVEIGKEFKFDPGALDRVWIKNCCAIGLSSIFVEPLEATSIGTSIQQVFLLMHRLPNYDEKTIDRFNKDMNGILMNIRDFIILHYLGKRQDTEFWKHIMDMEIPDSLNENLEKWRKNLPIAEDFSGISIYRMFSEAHHTHILAGLNMLDKEAISYEYELMHPEIKNMVENHLREMRTYEKINPSISHKDFIRRVRAMKGVT